MVTGLLGGVGRGCRSLFRQGLCTIIENLISPKVHVLLGPSFVELVAAYRLLLGLLSG